MLPNNDRSDDLSDHDSYAGDTTSCWGSLCEEIVTHYVAWTVCAAFFIAGVICSVWCTAWMLEYTYNSDCEHHTCIVAGAHADACRMDDRLYHNAFGYVYAEPVDAPWWRNKSRAALPSSLNDVCFHQDCCSYDDPQAVLDKLAQSENRIDCYRCYVPKPFTGWTEFELHYWHTLLDVPDAQYDVIMWMFALAIVGLCLLCCPPFLLYQLSKAPHENFSILLRLRAPLAGQRHYSVNRHGTET